MSTHATIYFCFYRKNNIIKKYICLNKFNIYIYIYIYIITIIYVYIEVCFRNKNLSHIKIK